MHASCSRPRWRRSASSWRDIREFLVTHIHRDHYTQAIALRREFGSSVSLGEGERLALEAMRTIEVHPDIAALYAGRRARSCPRCSPNGHGERDLTDWEDPDRWLPRRNRHRAARPGHCASSPRRAIPGVTSCSTIRQANALFAGDHVLPHITPSIGIELVRPPSPLRDYLASLRSDAVAAGRDAAAGTRTGRRSTHARVDELLAHHEQRLDADRGGDRTGCDAPASRSRTR